MPDDPLLLLAFLLHIPHQKSKMEHMDSRDKYRASEKSSKYE